MWLIVGGEDAYDTMIERRTRIDNTEHIESSVATMALTNAGISVNHPSSLHSSRFRTCSSADRLLETCRDWKFTLFITYLLATSFLLY